MTVYALMIETTVEGEWYFDVDSLYTTAEKAHLEATKRGVRSNNYYVDAMVVS